MSKSSRGGQGSRKAERRARRQEKARRAERVRAEACAVEVGEGPCMEIVLGDELTHLVLDRAVLVPHPVTGEPLSAPVDEATVLRLLGARYWSGPGLRALAGRLRAARWARLWDFEQELWELIDQVPGLRERVEEREAEVEQILAQRWPA